jgi:FkbM family methyltransferase
MEKQALRKTIERSWLKLIRFYTFNTPVSKGKYRLYQTALNMCRYPPKQMVTKIGDGRRFCVDLTGGMHQSVFFLGEYERAVTDVISSVVQKDDVCLDIGANFGWYTMLLNHLCRSGEVHAFEPMSDVFDELKQNWKLAGEPENVRLNNVALGDEAKMIDIHRFANLPSGFSSFATAGKGEYETFSVPMITLNSYLTENNVRDVDFMKIDIEGAELMFLRGATNLFEQKTPPVIMAEMALATTNGFGYLPNDLIEFLRGRAAYEFYALNDFDGTLRKIKGFAPNDIGANVLCIPNNCDSKRLQKLELADKF